MEFQKVTYHEWLKVFTSNPLAVGIKGFFLLAAVLSATLFLAAIGLSVFPSGTYPRIVLAIPGLFLAGVYLYVIGAIVFRLNIGGAVVLCSLLSAASIFGFDAYLG